MTPFGYAESADNGAPRDRAERKPTPSDRRCGTCRWWQAREGAAGLCLWAWTHEVATWMTDAPELMDAAEGTDCDVWEVGDVQRRE